MEHQNNRGKCGWCKNDVMIYHNKCELTGTMLSHILKKLNFEDIDYMHIECYNDIRKKYKVAQGLCIWCDEPINMIEIDNIKLVPPEIETYILKKGGVPHFYIHNDCSNKATDIINNDK
jgi:hypothetical protein